MMRQLAIGIAVLLLLSCRESSPARAPDETRPELFLLTPLPILWKESFSLDQPGSPALDALERHYRVTPVDLPSQVPDGGLLLAAQPRALPAEELVALDIWLRRGGRLLLLADPMLEWPSERPLGDPRRAPVAFPDTGLLRHWGLQLEAPNEGGPAWRRAGDLELDTVSPGTFVKVSGNCSVTPDGVAATCSLGRGTAVLIADADLLNADAVKQARHSVTNNLYALLVMLAPNSKR